MKQLVLTIELENVNGQFDPNLFARNIAFRALKWSKAVNIKGKNVDIVMKK